MTLTHTAALARLGHALSDGTRARILLALRDAPAYPSDLAETLGVSRQVMSNQLACLRGCGLVVGRPDGRRTEYRLADPHLAHALGDMLRLALVVDPDCCGPDCTCATGASSGTSTGARPGTTADGAGDEAAA
ncbi:winged helix-turn-helix domain-containing protein [Isoptericola hypogeus]|uniref:Winged helix-turn-helix domain-containing protein n=1 Tax=Isoptericola hypogeus TaxID=300179 RepID=A0ABN2JEY6_9MICO